VGINRDLAHSRKINHQPAIARAKSRKTMSSTADSSQDSGLRGGPDRPLHVVHICAARNEAWRLSYHAIPDSARVFEPALTRAKQLTFELLAEQRIDRFTGFGHFVSPRKMFW
jgi:hypothetical protein